MRKIVPIIFVVIAVSVLCYFMLFKHKTIKHLGNGTILEKTNNQTSINTINLSIKVNNFKKVNNVFKIPKNISSNDIIKISKTNRIINPVLVNHLINHISSLRTNGLLLVSGGLIYPTDSMFKAYVHLENGNANILITEDFLDYLFVYAQTEVFYYLVNNYLYTWLYSLLSSDLSVLEQLYQSGNKYALVPMIYESVALKILNNSFNPPIQVRDFVNKYIYLIKKSYGYYLLPLSYDKYCYSGFNLIESDYGLKIDRVKNLKDMMVCVKNLPFFDYTYYKDYLGDSKYDRFILAMLWLTNSRFSLNDSIHVKVALTWLYSLEICNNRLGNCFNLWYRIYKVLEAIFMNQSTISLYDLYIIVKRKLNNDLDINLWIKNWKYFRFNNEFSLFSITNVYPVKYIYNKLTYPNIKGNENLLLEYYNGQLNLSYILPKVRILPNELDIMACLDSWLLTKYYKLYDLENYQGYLKEISNIKRNITRTLFVDILKENLKSMKYYPVFMNEKYLKFKRVVTSLAFVSMFNSIIFKKRFGKPKSFIVLDNNVSVLVLPYFGLMEIYSEYFSNLIDYLKRLDINNEKLTEYLLEISNIFGNLLRISETEFYHGKIIKNFDVIKIYKNLNKLNNLALGPLLFKNLEYYNYKAYYYGAVNGINYEIVILKTNNKYLVFIGPVFNYNDFYSNRIISEKYWEKYISSSIQRPKVYSIFGLSSTNKNYLVL